MYKTPKYIIPEDNCFFVSDSHHHQSCKNWDIPLYKKRGYDSLEAHDEGLISAWNNVCNDDSVVFHLGDFVFEDPKGNKFRELCNRLVFGELHYLTGNHRSGSKQIYLEVLKLQYPEIAAREQEVYPLVWELHDKKSVIFWPDYLELYINKQGFVLSHYPLHVWNNQKESVIHCQGHQHGDDPESSFAATDYGKKIDLSVDNLPNHAPISLAQLRKIMDKKPIKKIGHH